METHVFNVEFISGAGSLPRQSPITLQELAPLIHFVPADVQREVFIDRLVPVIARWQANTSKRRMSKQEALALLRRVQANAEQLDDALDALDHATWAALDTQYIAAVAAVTNGDWTHGVLIQSYPELVLLEQELHRILAMVSEIARSAALAIEADETLEPGMAKKRLLIAEVAECYRALGRDYPRTYKGAWFPDFMAELGKIVGLRIGYRLVANTLKKLSP